MNTSLVSPAYEKLWSDPTLQARIDEGIRLHRQSDAVIRVTDFTGNPIAGVKLRVDQIDSPFQFGANIFKLGDYPLAELNRKYENAFCALFNGATVPFYWRTLEPERGRPRYAEHSVPITRRPPPDRVVKFCEERGLRMHGHTLVWSNRKYSIPDWLSTDPTEAEPFWENRFREIAERYGTHIKRWDVLNEAIAFSHEGPDGNRMQADYEDQSFVWAERYLPADACFYINETTGNSWTLDNPRYSLLIERLLAAGRRIDAIGLQFHLFSDAELSKTLAGQIYTPTTLLDILDHYARFKLPIHISEITLTSPGNTSDGLEAQALIARNFYRLWFSHASVEGITWWNLPDGGAAEAENTVYSGLLFDDMRPKPAYFALQNLIHHEWRTHTQGVTDADGCFRFRGFHGSYLIRTESGKRDSGTQSEITLEPGEITQQLIRL